MFKNIAAEVLDTEVTVKSDEDILNQVMALDDIIATVECDLEVDKAYRALHDLRAVAETAADGGLSAAMFADMDGSLSSLFGADIAVMSYEELAERLDSAASEDHDAQPRKSRIRDKLKKGAKIAAGLAVGAAALVAAKKLHKHVNSDGFHNRMAQEHTRRGRNIVNEIHTTASAIDHGDMKVATRKFSTKGGIISDKHRPLEDTARDVSRLSDSGTAEPLRKIHDHIEKLEKNGGDKDTILALRKKHNALIEGTHHVHRAKIHILKAASAQSKSYYAELKKQRSAPNKE